MNLTKRIIVMLCTSWAALQGCSHGHAHEAELPQFEVTTPLRRDTEITREYVCQIHAAQHIEVRALEEGYLQEIYVDEGEQVEEGQRLFQITPIVYQAELARRNAEAQFAEVEYQNTQILREGNVVSENELALARANRQRAAAERALARAHLKFARLDAPFDGIVGRLHVRKGSLLEEGELLTVLSDNSEMWVYFNVSEAEYLAYRRQTARADDHVQVTLRMADGEVFDQTGEIQTIEADFNNETGTIAFRAGFSNPDGLLRHGETGEILMTTQLPEALLIPQKATYDILDKKFVFVVEQDTVRAREIVVGEELPHLYVVQSGLEDGDRILLEGLRRVRDGDSIRPVERVASEVVEELDLPAE